MGDSTSAGDFVGGELKIREAGEKDMLLVYHWNNEPAVRSNSFNPNPIPLEDHASWFLRRLKDVSCRIYIVEASNIPAAQIRFGIAEEVATISYLVAPEFRGKGMGHLVLLEGIERLERDFPSVTRIEGLVQKNNIASIRAFEKARFDCGAADAAQPQALRFIKLIAP